MSFQKYDNIYYLKCMRHAWRRLEKEKRLNESYRKVRSQSAQLWMHRWHVLQMARIRARACVNKMISRSSLGAMELGFLQWKKDTVVERKLEDGLIRRQNNIVRKAMSRL